LAINFSSEITLIDFHDSFTYNIVSELRLKGIKCQVISIDQWQTGGLDTLTHLIAGHPARHVVIWGPGPGHPNDYLKRYNIGSTIRELFMLDNCFQLGICLGHQLIWGALGVRSEKSEKPIHGGRIRLNLPLWDEIKTVQLDNADIWVQRYNSLNLCYSDYQKLAKDRESCLKYGDPILHVQEGECLMGKFFRGLTYQFHPESIGTSYRQHFFEPVASFLYNGNDESKSRWYL
jgi:anthranilate/para-aminobenzoate synthase component II